MHRSHQITGSSIIPVALTCIIIVYFVCQAYDSEFQALQSTVFLFEEFRELRMLETFCLYLTIQGVRLSNAAGRGESLKCYETETSKLSGVEFQTLLLFKNHVFSFFFLSSL